MGLSITAPFRCALQRIYIFARSHMDELRSFVTKSLVITFVALQAVDCLDSLLLGDRWPGVSEPFYVIVGTIVTALYTPQVITLFKKGNGGTSS